MTSANTTRLPLITDWDDAYANRDYIADADEYISAWPVDALAFRERMTRQGRAMLNLPYGSHERLRYDLFLPEGNPKGIAAFVHGGYWMAFDKSNWSHLAAGMVARGWAVALPSYMLAPEARIAAITRQIANFLDVVASKLDGPLILAGHSAGGHLVSRMLCEDAPITDNVRKSLRGALSISGLHDLRPLLRTKMNDTLGLDEDEAIAESAALTQPFENMRLHAWVGAEERPEFIRQNDMLPMMWQGLGNECISTHDAGHHHFSVISGLGFADAPITDSFEKLAG